MLKCFRSLLENLFFWDLCFWFLLSILEIKFVVFFCNLVINFLNVLIVEILILLMLEYRVFRKLLSLEFDWFFVLLFGRGKFFNLFILFLIDLLLLDVFLNFFKNLGIFLLFLDLFFLLVFEVLSFLKRSLYCLIIMFFLKVFIKVFVFFLYVFVIVFLNFFRFLFSFDEFFDFLIFFILLVSVELGFLNLFKYEVIFVIILLCIIFLVKVFVKFDKFFLNVVIFVFLFFVLDLNIERRLFFSDNELSNDVLILFEFFLNFL